MKKYLYYLCFFCIVLNALFFPLLIKAEIPRVTFTNTQSENTGLFVTKKVISAVTGAEAPSEDSFAFHLKLNEKTAAEKEYRLFRNGKELYNYGGQLTTEKNESMIPTAFMTDRNGMFFIKANESACFEDLKEGTFYEISEEEQDSYIQSEPKGGAAVGTLTKEGASVVFTNNYIPKIPTEGNYSSLEIKKDILFPTGYHPPESPEFTFFLKIKGKPWKQEHFTVVDSETGTIISEDVTDENGCFSLKGGYTARFEEIPTDTDYEVTEESKSGWRNISSRNTTGALTAPVTYVGFTNAEVSFAVTKQLDKSADIKIPFLFNLKKENSAWGNVGYYLYNQSGLPVDSRLHRTDSNGNFTLFPEQTAIFIGAEPGSVYSVREIAENRFTQLIPANINGYENKTVTDSAEILPFVNHYEDTFLLPDTGGSGTASYLLFAIIGLAVTVSFFYLSFSLDKNV